MTDEQNTQEQHLPNQVAMHFDRARRDNILEAVRNIEGVEHIDQITHHWPRYAHLAVAMLHDDADGPGITEKIKSIPGMQSADFGMEF